MASSMLRIVYLLIVYLSAVVARAAAQQTLENAQISLHFSHAQQFLDQGKPDAAAGEFEAVLELNPNIAEAQANLGTILFFQNHCSEAIGHLSRAFAMQPTLDKIQALLGVCQKQEGQIEKAKQNLEAPLRSVKEMKVRVLIESNLVELYYAEGSLQLASQTADDLLKNDPHNPDVLYMIYRIHTDIADRARNALAVLAPESGRMHQMMAEHFVNEGDAPDAITQYERALAKDATLPGLHYELAEAIFQNSHSESSLDKAATLLQEALAQDPRNAGAEAKLGQIAAIGNHPDMAEKYFSRALALQSDQLDALEGMADIAAHRGENERAVNYLLRAAQIDPMDEKLFYRLSRLYRALNQQASSDRQLELFLKVRDLKKKTELAEQRQISP